MVFFLSSDIDVRAFKKSCRTLLSKIYSIENKAI